MAKVVLNEVVQRVQRTLLREEAGVTDGQLLKRFIEHGDDRAFAALVRRHGPLVLGVCRRHLPHHDAEDAFQATFLVLARKAASIASPELLGNWLHGVAHNTARKARAMIAKRHRREKQVTAMPEPEVAEHGLQPDLKPILDHEIRRLSEKYRLPLFLCDLEGKPRREVARQLGWPEGTLSGRLARARRMLARRLAQRGAGVSGGMLAVRLSENAASARVPTMLISATAKAATLFAAGQGTAEGALSASVVALTKGVLKSMLFTKLRIGILILLGMAMIVFGGGIITCQLAPAQQAAAPSSEAKPKVCPSAPVETKTKRYQVECTLIQLDPDGNDLGKDGKGKILAQPTLLVPEGTEGSFCSGGQIIVGVPVELLRVPTDNPSPKGLRNHDRDIAAAPAEKANPVAVLSYGTSIRIKILGLADGRLRLETTLELSSVDGDAENETQVGGKIVRSITTVKLGEPVRVTVKDDAGEISQWLTVKVVKEEIVLTQTRSAAADSMTKSGTWTSGVPVIADAGLTGSIRLNEGNFNIIPAPETSADHRELLRLNDDSTDEQLAPALEAKPLKADTKAVPAARVGQIFVVGNTKTPTDVIVKQLALFPGQVLEYPALRQAEKKLAKWKATVTIVENGEGSAYKDILVKVNEQ